MTDLDSVRRLGSEPPSTYAHHFSEFLAGDRRIQSFRDAHSADLERAVQHHKVLQEVLFDEGWSRLGWPEKFGGLGGDPRFRAALFECLWEQDITIPEAYLTLEVLGPAIMKYADHLGVRHFASLLRGDELWCQAFSEPDAGSDLASLRTRMELEGEGWRITGQKTWSTFGHLAQRSVLLARSGERGHRGLTMILLDLDQPGVVVRPIRTETGQNHFAEIFLDGAWLPADRIVGQPGQGWQVAMYMLQWERGAWGWQQQGRFHNRLGRAVREADVQRCQPAARSIGAAYAAMTALRVHTRTTVERLATGAILGPEVSVDKLLLADAETATWDVIRELYGSRFEYDADIEWLREEFLFSRAAPIYGGSQEIQRSLIAQRVLGMPRER